VFSKTNYYHTIDYSHDGGAKFACAGYEPVVEIYDEETSKKVQFFDKVDKVCHFNKIYCVKFDHRHPSVLYSGGWDRNVNVWDIRTGGKHCGTIYGPLIGGEAIDVDSKHHLLVTGSLHESEGVEMWDLRNL
jgi:WD40 repeat protein